jgi:transcriptional regulator with XRE-family HTH domain
MLPITDALLDTLKDYRDTHGWTSLQLARHIGVSHGTLSRWLSGRIASMREKVFEKVIARIGLEPTVFETGVVLESEFRARLVEALKARSIASSTDWREKIEAQCGVSYERAMEWIAGTSRSMRHDVYTRLCQALGFAPDTRPAVPYDQLPPVENPVAPDRLPTVHRPEQPYDSWDDPAKGNPQVPQVPVSYLEKVSLVDKDRYEKMLRGMRPVRFEGKVRLYAEGERRGPLRIAVVSGSGHVADGEKIAVRDGDQLVIGHLHLVPVLVRSETYFDLMRPEDVPSQACSGRLSRVRGALPESENRHLVSLTKPDTQQQVAGLAGETKCPLHRGNRRGGPWDNLPGRASAGTVAGAVGCFRVRRWHHYRHVGYGGQDGGRACYDGSC